MGVGLKDVLKSETYFRAKLKKLVMNIFQSTIIKTDYQRI